MTIIGRPMPKAIKSTNMFQSLKTTESLSAAQARAGIERSLVASGMTRGRAKRMINAVRSGSAAAPATEELDPAAVQALVDVMAPDKPKPQSDYGRRVFYGW